MPRHKRNRSRPQNTPAGSAVDQRSWQAAVGLALILLVTGLAYLPAVNGGVLWDDEEHIIKPELQSIHGLYRIWFEVGATQQYYPLLCTAFWLEHKLWGDSVLGYHLVTLLWHMISVVLLYLVLTRLKIPGALLAAAIFALHPVMVESVAWMSEQKNTLSAVFCLSAMLAYLKFDESRERLHYFVALGLFVLGLMSKTPISAPLPAMLLVIFWWQRGALSWKRDVQPLVPFLVFGILAGLVTAWVERKVLGAEGVDFELTLLQRILLANRVVWFYLGKLLWPANLVFIYPRWDINPREWWQWLFPIATLGTLLGLWAMRRKWRAPLAASLMFVVTLVPVLGFLNVYPFKWSFAADHYQYFASLGIIVLFSAGIAIGLERASLPICRVGMALCILLVGVLAVLTSKQSSTYVDAATLWRATLERNPDCWVAHNNLGTILSARGHQQEAIERYRAAIRARPNYHTAHTNLGMALVATGQLTDAFDQLQKAVVLQPKSVAARRNLGNALTEAGRHEEAIDELQAALLLAPEDPLTLNSFGVALTTIGRLPQAIEHLRHALRLDPSYAEARGNLGNALVQSGNVPEGIAELQKALALQPNDSWTITKLGIALVQAGSLEEAIRQFRHAAQLDPSAYAHNNLGNAIVKTGRLPEAIGEFQLSIRLDANFVQAYANLAQVLKRSNRSQEAIVTAKKGIEVARSTGDNSLAAQLEGWLTQAQAELQRENKVDPATQQ